jgi:hypothetical protein
MSEVFILINNSKHATREECNTIERDIGEEFLSRYAGCRGPEFRGYMTFEGQMVPFWNICCGTSDFLEERARIELHERNYIGKVVKLSSLY